MYNRCLEKTKKGEEKISFQDLRNKYVTKNPLVNEWELDTPKDIRAGAIRDLVKNYKVLFSQLKHRQINHFKIKFCSRRDSPAIEIPKSAIKYSSDKFTIYNTYLKSPLKQRGIKNIKIEYDCRLQCKNNKWFLLIPTKVKQKKYLNRKEYCSLDPGTRSFQTVYSETGVYQIKANIELLKKLQHRIDLFRSLRDRKIIKTKRLKRRERKVYFRLGNLIDDLHHKVISFLTSNFNHIILPNFESQEIAKKNRWGNRNLLQLKHFRFKERLKAKCELTETTLDICTEEYTTQTCGCCGERYDVGRDEVYHCTKCGLVIDRDVNAARNMTIKRLIELGV